jgi:YfiH family protein
LNIGVLTDDADAAVIENRTRLAAAVGIEPRSVPIGLQVHKADIALHDGPQEPSPYAEPGTALQEVDGHVVRHPGLAPLVLTADCLPVALCAPGAVAMVHAGWRGLAAGVLDEGLAALRDVGATGPVAAAIGPGAGGCCYEVGDEVREAFADVPEAMLGRNVDLKAVATARLRAAGVEAVHDSGLCTMCDGRFFSHRRDHGTTGRQGGVAWLA